MKLLGLVPLLATLLAAPAVAGDAVELIHESRTAEPGKKGAIRHVALLENTSSRSVHGLRVTVELYDYFGKLLWARTVVPSPSSLRPGDTASLSLTTPAFEAYRKTAYRFEYRPRSGAR